MDKSDADSGDEINCASVQLVRSDSKDTPLYWGLAVCLIVGTVVSVFLVCCAIDYMIAALGPGNFDDLSHMPIVGGYKLSYHHDEWRSVSNPNGTIRIRRDVRELGWDDQFIICRRYGPIDDGTASFPNGPPEWEWWIIDVHASKLHGPIKDADYEKARLELGVDAALVVREVKEYGI